MKSKTRCWTEKSNANCALSYNETEMKKVRKLHCIYITVTFDRRTAEDIKATYLNAFVKDRDIIEAVCCV